LTADQGQVQAFGLIDRGADLQALPFAGKTSSRAYKEIQGKSPQLQNHLLCRRSFSDRYSKTGATAKLDRRYTVAVVEQL